MTIKCNALLYFALIPMADVIHIGIQSHSDYHVKLSQTGYMKELNK